MDDRQFDAIARMLATPTTRRAALRRLALGLGAAGAFVDARRGASVSAAQNVDCAQFCQQLPPGTERGACVSDASAGTGLCSRADPHSRIRLSCCARACASIRISIHPTVVRVTWSVPPARSVTWDVHHPVPRRANSLQGLGACRSRPTRKIVGRAVINATFPMPARPVSRACAHWAPATRGGGTATGNPTDGCETNLREDLSNCGACGTICPTPANATPTCESGACGFDCLDGFDDCDGDSATGCERNLQTDPEHCGACGTDCPPDQTPPQHVSRGAARPNASRFLALWD